MSTITELPQVLKDKLPLCRVTPTSRIAATRHPLYELRDRAAAIEREIIETKIGDTEALLSHLLTMNMLVRGLIAVGLAEVEKP